MLKQRILLVEDEKLIRWWLTNFLNQEGFVVVAPQTIEEALRLGARETFDILISDWRLEDGHDGFEMLATVRAANPKIPAILISADADSELRQYALGVGFDCVILKPMKAADVLRAIEDFPRSECKKKDSNSGRLIPACAWSEFLPS